MKQRALAVLSNAGIQPAGALDAVGGAFWADILFVTGRARTKLSEEQLIALGKASVALGYGATAHALLSLDVKEASVKADLALEAYVQALSVNSVVFLEAEVANVVQQNRGGKSILLAEAEPTENNPSFIREIVVRDFFASLEEGCDQQDKKRQAWKELQAARLQLAMR